MHLNLLCDDSAFVRHPVERMRPVTGDGAAQHWKGLLRGLVVLVALATPIGLTIAATGGHLPAPASLSGVK